jgi:DNA-binding transcriptional LysR family regulator
MNSDDLALFAQVAGSASISRAALALGADQSTVSRRIGLLEAELGVRLFHRSGRGVTLTERGTALLAYAEQTAQTLLEAQGAMRTSAGLGPARLCIAAQPTIASILFGRLGKALKERFPLAQVRFVEGLAAHILPRLDDGSIDVGILYLPAHPVALQSDVLLTEEIHLIAPPDYPLADGDVAVRDLGNIALILPSTHHGLRVLVDMLAARHGFATQIALECDGSIALTKRLVREHCGCTVLPSAAVIEEVAAGQLKSYRLVDPAIQREIALVWPKNRATPEGMFAVTQIIRQCTRALVEEGAWPDAVLA